MHSTLSLKCCLADRMHIRDDGAAAGRSVLRLVHHRRHVVTSGWAVLLEVWIDQPSRIRRHCRHRTGAVEDLVRRRRSTGETSAVRLVVGLATKFSMVNQEIKKQLWINSLIMYNELRTYVPEADSCSRRNMESTCMHAVNSVN